MSDYSAVVNASVSLRVCMRSLNQYADRALFAQPLSEADFETLQLFCAARAALAKLAERHDVIEAAALDAAIEATP